MSLWGGKLLVDGYRLLQTIGRGAFGEVWEAESHGRQVALKFLRCSEGRGTADELRSLILLRGLAHPHLVNIQDIVSFPGYLVVTMELGEGSLADIVASRLRKHLPPMSPRVACDFLSQAASALDFLNSRCHKLKGRTVGIQHCDIKPSNLILVEGSVKLCDFGLAATTSGPTHPIGWSERGPTPRRNSSLVD
jgi:serine/threonine-protein kinase